MVLHQIICWLFLLTSLVTCSPSHAQGSNADDGSATGVCQQSICEPSPGRGLLQTHHYMGTREESVSVQGPVALATQAKRAPRFHEDSESSAHGKMKKYARLEQQVTAGPDGVAVLIPGLGDEKRALQVQKNIDWLKGQGVPFECTIFVYRPAEEFPLSASSFEPCKLVRHAGYWMEHVLAFPLNMTTKPWILHMMDSIEPQANVNLAEMFKIMRTNKLGHAAPTFQVDSGTPGIITDPSVYSLMSRSSYFTIGRFTDFIELHFDMFSREYFACLQDNVDMDNTLGWGVDRLLPSICGGAMLGATEDNGNLGLLDNMTMVKKFDGSYDHGLAADQMEAFILKHEGARQPFYTALGALTAPSTEVLDNGHPSPAVNATASNVASEGLFEKLKAHLWWR